MRIVRLTVVFAVLALLNGSAFAQQRTGVPAKLAIDSSEEAPVMAAGDRHYAGHAGDCEMCDGVSSYLEVAPDLCCLDRGCGRCPRVLPAIAGGIHAVADHVADSLAFVFPCYHRRWADCQPDLDCCCPQRCCRVLWRPSYRNCQSPCGGLQVPAAGVQLDSAPTPTPAKGAHRTWDPQKRVVNAAQGRESVAKSEVGAKGVTPATAVALNRKSAAAEVRSSPTPAKKPKTSVRSASLESGEDEEQPAKTQKAAGKTNSTVRRESNGSQAKSTSTANALRN